MTMTSASKRCPRCRLEFDASYGRCPLCADEKAVGRPLIEVLDVAEPKPSVSRRPLRFLNRAHVMKLVKENGKRASQEFLVQLDEWIGRKVTQACKAHNGGRKTLDACVAGQVGIK